MHTLTLATTLLCGAIRAVTPQIADGPWSKGWWLPRHEEKAVLATNMPAKVVFLGDSITHFWESNGNDARIRYFSEGDARMLCLGFSADRTENVLWRGMNGELDGYAAKCVMLLVGTNNARRREDPPEQTAAGIRRILDLIAERQPQAKVIPLPVFPFGASREDPKRIINDAVNAKIRGYADGEKVIWLDFTDRFLDDAGNNVKWMPDHCHPNAEGYREIWLPAVLPLLEKILKDSEE